jgi:serine protease Do
MMAACWTATAAAPDGQVQVLKETGKAFAAISKQAVPAVVFIQSEKDVKAMRPGQQFFFNDPSEVFGEEFFERFFGQRTPPHGNAPQRFSQVGQGSGFLISKDGYILTNNHVVGDADRITVRLQDGRSFKATRIGSDEKSEVAVIRIEGGDFPFLELGDSDSLEVGEWVLAIGNPFGLNETVTAGIVSAKGRSNIGIADYENFIQTDAAINPGNSGGPLINIEGKVVGINTAIYSRSGGYMGIGFAIPVNMARGIKDQLIKSGKVVRGYLGVVIQDVDRDLADAMGVKEAKGVLVSQVMESSAADKAGLEDGDVILKLDGRDVADAGSFRSEIAALSPGTSVKLEVLRDGKPRELKAETMELEGGAATAEAGEATADKLGLSVTDLTPEIAEQIGVKEDKGALVSEVDMSGPAWQAGLRQGMLIESVNREPVKSAQEFNAAVARVKHGKETPVLLLKVRDGRGSRYVPLRWE